MEQHPTNSNIQDLYNYVNYSLTLVEAKNGVLVALNSGTIIGILSLFNNHWMSGSLLDYLVLLPPMVSLYFALASFYPPRETLSLPQKGLCNGTLFNCENISAFSMEELTNILVEKNDISNFEKEKISYILETANRTARKYRLFRKGLKGFAVYVVIFILYISYLLIRFL